MNRAIKLPALPWPAVVLAVQFLYKFVYLFEIACCTDLPQQAILRHHGFQTHKFQLSSIFCVLSRIFITLRHYTVFFSTIRENGHLTVTFFDRLCLSYWEGVPLLTELIGMRTTGLFREAVLGRISLLWVKKEAKVPAIQTRLVFALQAR